jgi:AraC-like DNA-binding protein
MTQEPVLVTQNLVESRWKQGVQRVGFLTVLPPLLKSLGVDPSEVLTSAGLNPDALDDPESTIPYAAMGRVAELAAIRAKCPQIGLLIGQQIGTAALGVIGQLMRNAPTLGVALQDFANHHHRNAQGGVVYLLSSTQENFFGYAVYEPQAPGYHHICDGAAMAAFNLVSELTRSASSPVMAVLLSRSEPSERLHYDQLFGVPLHFNANQTAVQLPSGALDLPIPGADPTLRKTLEKRIWEYRRTAELDVLTELRRTLRIAVLKNRVAGEDLAADLGLSRRTLHRRLRSHGISFQQVLNETRCECAKQLLSATTLGSGEIGRIIGYADPTIFSRAFVRWTGMPPSQWRSKFATIEPQPHPMRRLPGAKA